MQKEKLPRLNQTLPSAALTTEYNPWTRRDQTANLASLRKTICRRHQRESSTLKLVPTMDIIKMAGGNPANFLDVGGGATKERVTLTKLQKFLVMISKDNLEALTENCLPPKFFQIVKIKNN